MGYIQISFAMNLPTFHLSHVYFYLPLQPLPLVIVIVAVKLHSVCYDHYPLRA